MDVLLPTRWEYIVLKVVYAEDGSAHVAAQNGKELGGLTSKHPPLHEVLNQLGQDGWKVAGTLSQGSAASVILRRLVEKPAKT